MSSFFAQHRQLTENLSQRNNPYAEPTPVDIEAICNLLGLSLRVRYDEISTLSEMEDETRAEHQARLNDMMEQIEELSTQNKIEGVQQSYLDELERVPKKQLKKGMTCPICAVDFIDDEYPLVVQLPCHPDHIFDLECIGPWLMLKSTCPLDRKELLKKKEVPKPVVEEEEEEDYDEYYA